MDLLCLPCAGASATMYWRWRPLLPGWLSVVPVELPGRGARLGEPFAADIGALVDGLCDEVVRRSPRQPWALLGHSMGALLAYGVVRGLRERGLQLPCALIVSGSAAPSRRDASRFAGKDTDDALIADLRRQGGTPEAVFDSPELLRMALDTLHADYRVCASYTHRTGLPLPLCVHALAGRHDDIPPEDVEAWRSEAGDGFSAHWFDGGHFFIREHEQQVVARLVGLLQPLQERLGAAAAA